jgi:hypothetical protein
MFPHLLLKRGKRSFNETTYEHGLGLILGRHF